MVQLVKDAGLYLLRSYYVGNPTIGRDLGDYRLFYPLGGQPGFQTGDRIGNSELKPELTTTFEVGGDFGLLMSGSTYPIPIIVQFTQIKL